MKAGGEVCCVHEYCIDREKRLPSRERKERRLRFSVAVFDYYVFCLVRFDNCQNILN